MLIFKNIGKLDFLYAPPQIFCFFMLKNGIPHTNNYFHKIRGGALVGNLGTILRPIWALPGCILKKTLRLTWKFFPVKFFRKNSSNYSMNHGFNSRNSMGSTPWYNKVGWGAYTKNNKFCSFGIIEKIENHFQLRILPAHYYSCRERGFAAVLVKFFIFFT